MPPFSIVKQQIESLVIYLVDIGIASDQNFPFRRSNYDGKIEVTFPGAMHVSVAMRDKSYAEIYDHLIRERAYNIKMVDGAMIQMMYLFDDTTLETHRLAFFPSPYLEEFQNYPEIYLEDEIYADIVAKNIVTFPLRFDYDAREGVFRELEHPKSHLSLGQYANCRIPVSAPVTPYQFINFILRNFYHTAHEKYAERLPYFSQVFRETIIGSEKSVIHVKIPRSEV